MTGILQESGGGAKVALALMAAIAACTLLAGLTAISEKSYFIDTRRPVVAMSAAGGLDTNPGESFILVR